MGGWMIALLPDNILSVRFYYYPYYRNEKTDAYMVNWHVPAYLAIKKPGFETTFYRTKFYKMPESAH